VLLEAAADRTQETVYLNMLDRDHAVCVQIAESPQSVKGAIKLGERNALHAGSRCRVMLVRLPSSMRYPPRTRRP
jgi:DNA-binding IclR family transcriptional regulator